MKTSINLILLSLGLLAFDTNAANFNHKVYRMVLPHHLVIMIHVP